MNAAKCFSSSLEVENLRVSESKSSVLLHSTELSEMGNTGQNRVVPQAGLSEGPMKMSAGNLCFSDLAREFGVWLGCNRDV